MKLLRLPAILRRLRTWWSHLGLERYEREAGAAEPPTLAQTVETTHTDKDGKEVRVTVRKARPAADSKLALAVLKHEAELIGGCGLRTILRSLRG